MKEKNKSLIDPKRTMNIDIVLKSLKKTNKYICNAVLSCDENFLTFSTISSLS